VIAVVAAVIEQDDAFLLTRRQKGVHLEGLWEFPGGKIDPDETPRDALRRELREELDTDIEIGELVCSHTHAYQERTVRLYFYACTLRGTPRPMLGQEMRWVPRTALRLLRFPAADEELIKRLTAAVEP
jgi:8-oxo-dGTP diphosphatase